MAAALSVPTILRSEIDEAFDLRVPTFRLRWDATDIRERLWDLPEGVCLVGPPPEKFALKVQRRGRDSFAVKLLWNRTLMSWHNLTRVQLLTTGLAPLLEALGNDLRDLLEQPIRGEHLRLFRAA